MKVSGPPPTDAKKERPKKKTNDVAAFINQATFNDPYISESDLHTQIDQTIHTSICPTTINEFRREIGFKYLPPLHEPLLTDIQVQKRINFSYDIQKNLVFRWEVKRIFMENEMKIQKLLFIKLTFLRQL